MATWAIGDIQGCRPELERLLEKLAFDPASDRLWLCGDLVNRGGESLAVLRLLRQLGDAVTITLGNHDLGLLAVAERDEEGRSRVNPDLREVLFAPDAEDILAWLRQQSLLHHDRESNWCMVHAGLAPGWSLRQAGHEAQLVEQVLAGPQHGKLLRRMFGNKPARWTPRLRGIDRQRATINVLTRMRFCDVHGRIDFNAKGAPGTQPAGLYPWFATPGMKQRKERIVCGHWSALGRFAGLGVHALDTGCVWGGRLTAMRLDDADAAASGPHYVSVPAEAWREPPAEGHGKRRQGSGQHGFKAPRPRSRRRHKRGAPAGQSSERPVTQ